MSQKVARKSAVTDDKEKRTDSPVKDLKKKMAANVEKEKQATVTDKQTDKVEKKQPDKNGDKASDKKVEKNGVADKKTEAKKDDKKTEKEKDGHDKNVRENGNKDKNGKDKDGKERNGQPDKSSASGANASANGAPNTNGADDSVSDSSEEMFPELAYDDSDEAFDLPERGHSRSFTRRSQVKSTRTPETPAPRPPSDKLPATTQAPQAHSAADTGDSKDSKILKLNEAPTDRKLRSADDTKKAQESPKPDANKAQESPKQDAKKAQDSSKPDAKKGQESPKPDAKKAQESPKQDAKKAQDLPKNDGKKAESSEGKEEKKTEGKKNGENGAMEVEIIIDLDADEELEPRKVGTNFSKSRVKVSPYRRSGRLADQTNSSLQANYTGNNTTMEMDITESSFASEEASASVLDDSAYLSGLRAIRGRRSYKLLKDLPLRERGRNRSAAGSAAALIGTETSRPTGTVVGRKRKPDAECGVGECGDGDGDVELAVEAGGWTGAAGGKRMRLLDRLAGPFRRSARTRGSVEIVGINTDLPLSAPITPLDTLDPETVKDPLTQTHTARATPTVDDHVKDGKRCIVM